MPPRLPSFEWNDGRRLRTSLSSLAIHDSSNAVSYDETSSGDTGRNSSGEAVLYDEMAEKAASAASMPDFIDVCVPARSSSTVSVPHLSSAQRGERGTHP